MIYIYSIHLLCFLLGYVPIVSYALAEHDPKYPKKHQETISNKDENVNN